MRSAGNSDIPRASPDEMAAKSLADHLNVTWAERRHEESIRNDDRMEKWQARFQIWERFAA